MKKKTLSKEELIVRLKEISADKPEVVLMMHAMCYDIDLTNFKPKHTNCEKCDADIEYGDMFDDRERICEIVKKIVGLGYDAKVEVCCEKCAEKLVEEVHPKDKIQNDEDKYYYISSINYLFSFRLKDDDKYHMCIANDVEKYKLLLALLENKSYYDDSNDSIHYIADEKNLLKYMTGINFDE